VLEGFVDLLFETPEGYEIVDYKTDDLREDEADGRMAGYRIQGDSYAELVRAITGKAPVAVSFVFVSAGRVVPLIPSASAGGASIGSCVMAWRRRLA
jgi:ATP-dependent helicase/nuclease subunit A